MENFAARLRNPEYAGTTVDGAHTTMQHAISSNRSATPSIGDANLCCLGMSPGMHAQELAWFATDSVFKWSARDV